MLLSDRGIGVSQVTLGGELTSAQSLASKLNAVDSGWTGAPLDTSSFTALNKTGSWSAMMWEPGASTGHWVVVDGLNAAGNVVIRDPAGVGTTYTMTVDAFKEIWNGYTVFKKQ
jgi:filamentous hemagglutinin